MLATEKQNRIKEIEIPTLLPFIFKYTVYVNM